MHAVQADPLAPDLGWERAQAPGQVGAEGPAQAKPRSPTSYNSVPALAADSALADPSLADLALADPLLADLALAGPALEDLALGLARQVRAKDPAGLRSCPPIPAASATAKNGHKTARADVRRFRTSFATTIPDLISRRNIRAGLAGEPPGRFAGQPRQP